MLWWFSYTLNLRLHLFVSHSTSSLRCIIVCVLLPWYFEKTCPLNNQTKCHPNLQKVSISFLQSSSINKPIPLRLYHYSNHPLYNLPPNTFTSPHQTHSPKLQFTPFPLTRKKSNRFHRKVKHAHAYTHTHARDHNKGTKKRIESPGRKSDKIIHSSNERMCSEKYYS